jgi:hypothetical protein
MLIVVKLDNVIGKDEKSYEDKDCDGVIRKKPIPLFIPENSNSLNEAEKELILEKFELRNDANKNDRRALQLNGELLSELLCASKIL